ncbi:hypothetical protein DMUE_0170 [Dictyocoela muelleri]|nr:hypothetical protein DMUE_0170 [Dictyocoela muelleri]
MELKFKEYEELHSNICHQLAQKVCLKCVSKVRYFSKKKFLVCCTCQYCRNISSVFQGPIFTSRVDKNLMKLFILSNWLAGSSVGEIENWFLISRHVVYKTLRKLEKSNIIEKYYDIIQKIE